MKLTLIDCLSFVRCHIPYYYDVIDNTQCRILFQNVALHHHELPLFDAARSCVHRLRDKRSGDAQTTVVLLRGILHLPLRHEHPVPLVRFLLPPSRERLLCEGRRHTATTTQAAQIWLEGTEGI